MTPERPDFSLRSTWVALFRQVASNPSNPTEPHDPGQGPPPIRPFGNDDPSIEAWSIAMQAGDPSAASRLMGLVGEAADDEPAPMLAPRDDLAIEVWTECELSVMHAAWRIVIKADGDSGVAGLEQRVKSAIAWHLERTQPDNATTHPWGVHAVLELGSPWMEAADYAASMIHAVEASSHVSTGLDPLSSWILLDAAAGLEARNGLDFGA